MKKTIIALALLFYLASLVCQFLIVPGRVVQDGAALRFVSETSAAVIILVSGLGLGVLFFQAFFKFSPETGLEKLVALGFGFVALSWLGFSVCATHLLNHWLVFMVLSLTFFLGVAQILKQEYKSPELKYGPFTWVMIICLGLFLFACLLGALTPAQKWDEQVYHLLLPKLYFIHSGFYNMDANVYSAFPQDQEMVYTLAMSLSDSIGAKLFHFACAVLVLAALVLLGKEIFKDARAGVWAAVFFAFCPTFYFEAKSAYIEMSVCFFVLLSVYGAFRFKEQQSLKWLVASALLAGAGLATKYTVYAGLSANLLLIFLWSKKKRLSKTFLYLCLAVSMLIPWFVKNLILTGNPVFPFFPGLFHGSDWDRLFVSRWYYSLRLEGMGRRFFDYLALFYRLFTYGNEETFYFDARFSRMLLFIPPLSFIFLRGRRNLWPWLWFLTVFVFWALGPQHGRFLISGVAVLSLIAGATTVKMISVCGKYLGFLVGVVAFMLSLSYAPYANFEIKDWLKFIAGRQTTEQYLTSHKSKLGLMRIDEILEINRKTPPGSKIFMLWENRCLYLDRDCLADSSFEASYTKHLMVELGSAEEFREWLVQNDYKYIYNGRLWPWDQDKYLQAETLEEFRRAEAVYQDFLQKYGELVFREQGELVRVK